MKTDDLRSVLLRFGARFEGRSANRQSSIINRQLSVAVHLAGRKSRIRAFLSAILVLGIVGVPWNAHPQKKVPQPELLTGAYYQRWLEEDVAWIITEEERDVFTRLKADEERDAFIEQFWARRDPDPSTFENEFKVEHYRRLVYASEHFTAGIAGWKSDRGRIYIRFGSPDRFESYPAGGTYVRERKEGGGLTTIFPMERWEYRRIEGIGDDIVLEFVDDKGGGLYELTFDNQRKDALLLSGLMGLTQDEAERESMAGSTDKQDRVARRRIAGDWRGAYSGAGGFESAKDKPFEQLILSAGLNRAPAIRYKDLEAIVSARISYTGLPFDIRQDFIRLTEQQVLVPITVLVANQEMTFKRIDDVYRAGAQIFGRVVGLANRVESVFEDEIAKELTPAVFEKARSRSSAYQRRLILKPGLYKLAVAVKDVESGRIGTVERRLEVPKFEPGQLRLSSLILADRIETGTQDRSTSSFILGDLKLIPKTDDTFSQSGELGLYMQIYNFMVDQQSLRPSLKVEHAVSRRGSAPAVWRDSSTLIQFAGQYCRLARMINLSRFQAGEYELHLRVRDSISNQIASASAPFRIK